MNKLIIHLINTRGVKTIIKNLKRFDKNLVVREYQSLIVVESNQITHYIACNGYTLHKMCMVIYDSNDYSKEIFIPLSKIDTIFA